MSFIENQSRAYRFLRSNVKGVKAWSRFLQNGQNNLRLEKRVRSLVRRIDRSDTLKKINKTVDRLLKLDIQLSVDTLDDLRDKIIAAYGNIDLNKFKPVVEIIFKDSPPRYLTWSENAREGIMSLINSGMETQNVNAHGSDEVANIDVNQVESIEFTTIKRDNKKNKNGKFFKYVNESEFDLSRYQIFKSFDEYNESDKEHCIIKSISYYVDDAALLNNIKLSFVSSSSYNKSKLHELSKMINRQIVLYTYDNSLKLQDYKFGKGEPLKIALYKEHYFLYEETPWTVAKIKGKRERDYHKKATSLQVVKELDKMNLLKQDSDLVCQIKERNLDKRDYLLNDNIVNDQKKFEFKEKEKKDYSIFYADFETITEKHKPYLCGIVHQDAKDVYIIEADKNDEKLMMMKMLKYVVNHTKNGQTPVVYFHNLKYDFTILKNIYVKSICSKDGQIYSAKTIFNKTEIEFRDSYKIINVSLNKFNKYLGLDKELDKKEAIAYSFYKKEHLQNPIVKVKEYAKQLYKKDDKDIFIDSLNKNKKLFKYDGKNFDCIAYYKYYLKYDCLVLRAGMQKFNKFMTEMNEGQSIYDTLTISSYIDYYFKKKGAYDGAYMVTGNLRQFLNMSVMGGRCDVNKKYQNKVIINKRITDFDAVSLYPSAIKRYCEESGIPMGKAKMIKDNKWQDKRYYVVKIRINKINKKQQIPFIAAKKDSIIEYTNKIDKEPLEVIVDKITLEDWVNFQKIKYEFVEGVYWDCEVNKKMGELIQELFEKRKQEKTNRKKYNPSDDKYQEHNLKQELIKLMLNSVYGKTIIKPSYDKYHFVPTDRKNDFYCNNYDNVIDMTPVNDKQWLFKLYTTDTSYNFAHVGTNILSYSKRIMNEVFDIANDNKITIYYQDTDSLHMKQKDVKKLVELYKSKYGKDLIGEDLGQFHEDFDFNGYDNKISNFSIFHGKKIYLDIIEGVDKNGNTGYKSHTRIKGINEVAIYNKIKEYHPDDQIEGLKRLFIDIVKDRDETEPIEFCLNPVDKPSFEFNNGFSVTTKPTGKFTRCL